VYTQQAKPSYFIHRLQSVKNWRMCPKGAIGKKRCVPREPEVCSCLYCTRRPRKGWPLSIRYRRSTRAKIWWTAFASWSSTFVRERLFTVKPNKRDALKVNCKTPDLALCKRCRPERIKSQEQRKEKIGANHGRPPERDTGGS